MKIFEKHVDFPISRSEINLIREMAGEFILAFPDAVDVQNFVERLTDFYFQNFEE